MSDDNPFANLGAPPESDDPKGQVEYLLHVLQAFGQSTEPRLKPLRAKLYATFEDIKANPGPDDEQKLKARLAMLQIEAYDLLSVLVNQVRATLRVQLGRGMPKPQRVDSEKLQQELANYAQGIRKLISALKTGDQQKRRDAHAILEAVGRETVIMDKQESEGE